MNADQGSGPRRVLLLGGTGTIGRATVAALTARGHQVVCPLRPRAGVGGSLDREPSTRLLPGAELFFGEVTDKAWLETEVFAGRNFDAVLSCLASRSGEPRDAWAIDHRAHLDVLTLAQAGGVKQMVLLSAICVQKPRLAFQYAKLAFEQALIESGLTWSIVRPTAYFKSLSGQLQRLRQGKPFLVFGDGELTACKPISDADLAAYLVDCLEDESLHNRILPIGGPGPAITPRQQGEALFRLLGREPRFRRVPVSLLRNIATVLGGLGKILPRLAVKAELARIGHYYATESMLVLDPESGRYDTAATPETGSETLFDYYRLLVESGEAVDRGDHAVF